MSDLKDALQEIEKYILENDKEDLKEIKEIVENLRQRFQVSDSETIASELQNKLLYSLKHSSKCSDYAKIYIASVCVKIFKNPDFFRYLQELSINSEQLTLYNKYFIYGQLEYIQFVNPPFATEKSLGLSFKLYRDIYQEFYNQIGYRHTFLARKERNKELIVVVTSQFLEIGHGPTKTTLDRCYILKKYLKKQVMIINTALQISQIGKIGFYKSLVGNYIEEWTNVDQIKYLDEHFAFFQCDDNMPDIETLKFLLNTIQQLKPYCILGIGGDDILVDLCHNITPTIVISTIPSSLCATCGQFQVIGHKFSPRSEPLLNILGQDFSNIIECLFTSTFRQQTYHYTRDSLNLWQNKFLLVVVGWRLAEEVTPEFLHVLNRLSSYQIGVVFIGQFLDYDSILNEYPDLKNISINLGKQDDILAILECCDLYVNPKRVGGGTSVAEALYKGIPVVTLNYGDGGLGAGKDFWVKDFDEMVSTITEYILNPAFYRSQSQKAVERARVLTDSKSHLIHILEEAEKNPLFG